MMYYSGPLNNYGEGRPTYWPGLNFGNAHPGISPAVGPIDMASYMRSDDPVAGLQADLYNWWDNITPCGISGVSPLSPHLPHQVVETEGGGQLASPEETPDVVDDTDGAGTVNSGKSS